MDSIQDFMDSCNSDNSCSLTNSTITTNSSNNNISNAIVGSSSPSGSTTTSSRYENQKRRDWNTFGQYLKNHRPPLSLSRCSGAHVLEFLRYMPTKKYEWVSNSVFIFYKQVLVEEKYLEVEIESWNLEHLLFFDKEISVQFHFFFSN